jgi:hypothetical protein
VVFLNSPCRETPKNAIKTNRGKSALIFLWMFWLNFFDMDLGGGGLMAFSNSTR